MLVLYFHPVSKLLLFWGFFANTSVHITPAGLKVLQLNVDKRQIILSVHSYIHSKTLNCANSHLDVSHLKGHVRGLQFCHWLLLNTQMFQMLKGNVISLWEEILPPIFLTKWYFKIIFELHCVYLLFLIRLHVVTMYVHDFFTWKCKITSITKKCNKDKREEQTACEPWCISSGKVMTVLKVLLIVVGRAHVWLGEGVKNSQTPLINTNGLSHYSLVKTV